MTRILHIITNYWGCTFYRLLLGQLATHGVDNRVLVYDNVRHDDLPVTEQGVTTFNRSFSALSRVLYFPKQRAVYRFVQEQGLAKETDMVHAHTLFSAGYIAYRLYKQYGIPYIVAVRDTDVNTFMKYLPWLRPLGRKIMRHAKQVIFISPSYQRKYPTPHSLVIPNGIDPFYLQHVQRHTPDATCIRLLFIGELTKRKNIRTTIAVADRLIQMGETVRLTLIGKMKDERYRTLIEERDYITYYPFMAKEDLITHFGQNDIYIMPSLTETFGITYAEALSQGLPVIYTRNEGFDGHFEDGEVGYAVPSTDVAYIADKVLAIRANYDTMSTNANSSISRFDWATIAQQYADIDKSI